MEGYLIMGTTREDIREWFIRGQEQKADYMVVVCDTFDYEDYPVFVSANEDIHAVVAKYNGPNMQKVMEVYNLSMDMETQISQERSFNY